MSSTGSTPSKWLSNDPKSSPTPPKPSTPTSNRINPSTHLSPRATVKLPTTVPGGTTASLVFSESVLHLRLEAMEAGNHGVISCSENEEGELKAKAHSGYPEPERISGPWFETAITGFETTYEDFHDRICWAKPLGKDVLCAICGVRLVGSRDEGSSGSASMEEDSDESAGVRKEAAGLKVLVTFGKKVLLNRNGIVVRAESKAEWKKIRVEQSRVG